MKLIDIHGHLNLQPLLANWEKILETNLTRGVVRIVVPGTSLVSSRVAVDLARQRPRQLTAAVGVHPTEIQGGLSTSALEELRVLAKDPVVVAIGEVGLDIYRTAGAEANDKDGSLHNLKTILSRQEQALREFFAIAAEVDKPIIIHCRGGRTGVAEDAAVDPYEQLISLLASIPNAPTFVMHCYQGSLVQAERFIELGGYISFTGTITFTKDPKVRELLSSLPGDRLLAETDSPFLSPSPFRGEVNEPWKVIEVVRTIAQARGIPLAVAAEQLYATACRVFALEDID